VSARRRRSVSCSKSGSESMNKGVCGRMRRCGGRRGELAEEREVCVRQSAMRVELSVKKKIYDS